MRGLSLSKENVIAAIESNGVSCKIPGRFIRCVGMKLIVRITRPANADGRGRLDVEVVDSPAMLVLSSVVVVERLEHLLNELLSPPPLIREAKGIKPECLVA